MAKPLREIAFKKPKIVPGSIGTDAGVDYKPKDKMGQDFVAAHKVEIHTNDTDDAMFKGTVVKYALDTPQNSRMGRNQKETEAAYR